ncbi:MAG: galactonate dehydratase [Planctomycetia bacterium]|nr:galactonate dehydratase [Planctomycetia bacterium]
MKITAIRTLLCHAWRTNWLFVKVMTDVDGLWGVGEATLEYKEEATVGACRDLERELIGRNPLQIEAIWQDAYRDAYWRGGPVLMSALSAVDMALWDILGKELGVPVWQLFGGKVREEVPCYANAWFASARTPEQFGEKASAAVERGFHALKWDPFGSAWRSLDRNAYTQAMACVREVSRAVGDRAGVMIEGHGRFDLPTAAHIARGLEEYDVLWFEEPIIPDSIESLARLRREINVPVAFGERLFGMNAFRTLLEAGAADYIQPDVSHAGGLSELRRIAALAETYHVPICPHNPSGPVANAATLQLAASLPNFYLLETMATDVPWRREVCDEEVRLHNGCMTIPSRPGLGIELNEQEIAKHPWQPISLRHYKGTLTDIRPENATSFFREDP